MSIKTVDTEACKRVQEYCAQLEEWVPAIKSAFPMIFHGSHKYEVKAITTPLVGSGKYVRTYYVCSIAHFLYLLNQDVDLIYKVHSEHYEAIKNGFVTSHLITRIY